VLSSPWVVRVVGNARGPLPVHVDEIDSIRRIVDARLSVEPWTFLEQGQRVRIEAGPLRGTEGVVQHVTGRQRLVVSISLLQRSVAVEIAPEWVVVPFVPWHDALARR